MVSMTRNSAHLAGWKLTYGYNVKGGITARLRLLHGLKLYDGKHPAPQLEKQGGPVPDAIRKDPPSNHAQSDPSQPDLTVPQTKTRKVLPSLFSKEEMAGKHQAI